MSGVDRARYLENGETSRGRQAVRHDCETTVPRYGMRAVPIVIVPDGCGVIGAAPLSAHQRVLGV